MNKQIDNLRNDPDSPNSTTPYSRTPELRVTHKLAERKRRSEMKDCFEQLRQRLPSGQTNKSSKWETLSRGTFCLSPRRYILLTSHTAIDYITSLEDEVKRQRIDSDKQRHRLQEMEHKMQQMNEQLQRLQHQGPYPPPPNAMPQSPMNYNSHYANSIDHASEPARTLPPLMNGAMQGVHYSDDRR